MRERERTELELNSFLLFFIYVFKYWLFSFFFALWIECIFSKKKISSGSSSWTLVFVLFNVNYLFALAQFFVCLFVWSKKKTHTHTKVLIFFSFILLIQFGSTGKRLSLKFFFLHFVVFVLLNDDNDGNNHLAYNKYTCQVSIMDESMKSIVILICDTKRLDCVDVLSIHCLFVIILFANWLGFTPKT